LLPAVVGHAVHNAMPLALVAWAGDAAFDAELVSPLSAALPTEIVAAAAVAFAAGLGAFMGATAESAGSPRPR
jgi:predicted membrane-bound mannosyltransferase